MADRSTKKSLERFKYEVADELGVPGKTDGWQRRKHPVTHLSQCTKEKSRSLSRRPAYSFTGIYKFIFESCSS